MDIVWQIEKKAHLSGRAGMRKSASERGGDCGNQDASRKRTKINNDSLSTSARK